MSINSAMSAGVAGLKAYSSGLSVIADNIANVNTVGYKRGQADFSSLVTTEEQASFSAGGVEVNQRSFISQSGLLQQTSSATDLAIQGEGFFVVSPTPSNVSQIAPPQFTRAGSFSPDEDGFLRNSAGLYLQGWPLDPITGEAPANPNDVSFLEPINIDGLGGDAEPTANVTFNANLRHSTAISAAAQTAPATYDATNTAINMASGAVTPDFQNSVRIFDSVGGFRQLTYSFLKSNVPNQWHVEIHANPPTDVETAGTAFVDGQVATGIIAFTSNGDYDAANTTVPTTLNFNASNNAGPGLKWATGLGIAAQTVELNLGNAGSAGGVTQKEGPSELLSTTTDGAAFGSLREIAVDSDGYVNAFFNNGIVRPIYQIPVATFINADGLTAISGNAYNVSETSGTFNLQPPGYGGSGSIASARLESSTVDLAKEFTDLITTQRAYSASTRIITTADQMLEELIRIKN